MRDDLPSGTVTFLFTDVEGSTRLLHALGAEAYAEALADHRAVIRDACAAEGGVEVDTQGDAFLFAFPTGRRAVAAAAAFTEALSSGPIQVRAGLHTGTPLLTDEGYIGDDVHLGARVASAAHGGQVVFSPSTRELLVDAVLVTDLGEHRLKDIEHAVSIYQLGEASFPPLKTISNTNLPRPASSFLGREAELAEVLSRIEAGARLVTLTGPGGTGKTRLALEAASTLVPSYKAGVFWVGLADLRDPALVMETVGQTLGAKDGLAAHIAERELLLLLDNLEQVVEAASALSELLRACPNLTLLCTSRELLRISGEVEYAVPPLASEEAVNLFCARAGLDQNEEIADLCARLDSLPLAIELAAARTRALSVSQIAERLSVRLDLLKGGRDADPRQQTLRATIEWSYELLTPGEQTLFGRLSVFAGGCTLDAAEELCDADLDTLQLLVEKSLLRFTPSKAGGRYWMLETIREFASERLDDSNEARRRHALHFLAVAEQLELDSRGNAPAHAYKTFDLELANLRAAIDWAREVGNAETLGRFAVALWRFWADRGQIAEGADVLEEAVAATPEPAARALVGLCTLRLMSGTGAGELLTDAEHALAACKEAGDDLALAQAWNLVGKLRGSVLAQLGPAENAFEQALACAKRIGHQGEMAASIWGLTLCATFGPLPVRAGLARSDELLLLVADQLEARAFCLSARGVLEAMEGRFDVARSHVDEGTRTFEDLGHSVWAANNAQLSFVIETLAGNPKAAVRSLSRSFDRLSEMGERGFLSTIAGYLAHALYALDDLDEALRYTQASEDAAADDDIPTQVTWRTARAKIMAQRGAVDAAKQLAHEAVDIAATTDSLNLQGDALLDLAEVLTIGGRRSEAYSAAQKALRRYARKGNVAAEAHAKRLACHGSC